jgi:hypothetical protein
VAKRKADDKQRQAGDIPEAENSLMIPIRRLHICRQLLLIFLSLAMLSAGATEEDWLKFDKEVIANSKQAFESAAAKAITARNSSAVFCWRVNSAMRAQSVHFF